MTDSPASDIPIKVVSDAEAETAEYAVCLRDGSPTPFTDNLKGECALCAAPIIFRPYIPKKPMKVCLECMLQIVEATKQ